MKQIEANPGYYQQRYLYDKWLPWTRGTRMKAKAVDDAYMKQGQVCYKCGRVDGEFGRLELDFTPEMSFYGLVCLCCKVEMMKGLCPFSNESEVT